MLSGLRSAPAAAWFWEAPLERLPGLVGTREFGELRGAAHHGECAGLGLPTKSPRPEWATVPCTRRTREGVLRELGCPVSPPVGPAVRLRAFGFDSPRFAPARAAAATAALLVGA